MRCNVYPHTRGIQVGIGKVFIFNRMNGLLQLGAVLN